MYGNNFLILSFMVDILIRLRRTLLYGNHLLFYLELWNILLFKKNIVVWKLYIIIFNHIFPCLRRTLLYGNYILSPTSLFFVLFKKNIVVWKPYSILSPFLRNLFKKNTVVWKHYDIPATDDDEDCLRRTLLYGNF